MKTGTEIQEIAGDKNVVQKNSVCFFNNNF